VEPPLPPASESRAWCNTVDVLTIWANRQQYLRSDLRRRLTRPHRFRNEPREQSDPAVESWVVSTQDLKLRSLSPICRHTSNDEDRSVADIFRIQPGNQVHARIPLIDLGLINPRKGVTAVYSRRYKPATTAPCGFEGSTTVFDQYSAESIGADVLMRRCNAKQTRSSSALLTDFNFQSPPLHERDLPMVHSLRVHAACTATPATTRCNFLVVDVALVSTQRRGRHNRQS